MGEVAVAWFKFLSWPCGRDRRKDAPSVELAMRERQQPVSSCTARRSTGWSLDRTCTKNSFPNEKENLSSLSVSMLKCSGSLDCPTYGASLYDRLTNYWSADSDSAGHTSHLLQNTVHLRFVHYGPAVALARWIQFTPYLRKIHFNIILASVACSAHPFTKNVAKASHRVFFSAVRVQFTLF
jgi:hypothetical protein